MRMRRATVALPERLDRAVEAAFAPQRERE